MSECQYTGKTCWYFIQVRPKWRTTPGKGVQRSFSLANMLHLKDAASLMKLSLGRLEENPVYHVYVRS